MTYPTPRPVTDQSAGAAPEAHAGWRFTNHYRPGAGAGERGPWCRWSLVTVSAKLANSDDTRCLAECPGSDIEQVAVPHNEG